MAVIDLENLTKGENEIFNSIASDIKYDYDDIVTKLSEDNILNINWIVGSVASRNKYQSKLFERCCKLVLIQKLLDSESKITRIELLDSTLARLIEDYVIKYNYSIKVVSNETFLQYLWRITRPFRQLLIGFYQYLWRFISSSKKYISQLNIIDSITLLDTFVLNSTPGAGGTIHNKKYYDRYYTGIFDHLSVSESKKIYYLPTIVGFWNPASTFSMIRNCKEKFIVPDDFMSLSDYLTILLHPFKLLRINIPNILFKGINIKSLIKQEIYHTCSDQISLLGVLYYIFPYRLKSNGIKIRLLVDWFENQVIDRGLECGFHKFLPNVKTIGYQGYIISPALHLYIFPNKTEILSKAIPDEIGVIGEGLINQIKIFSKDLNVVVSPAFRFQKLWHKRKKYPSKGFFTILVSLPISLSDSKIILEKIVLINDNLNKSSDNYRIIIKPHPTYTIQTIKSLVKYNWDKIYRFSSGDFIDILEQSNLVITNASSTAVEPLARAVPVIIVGDENGILQNPIPNTINKEMWKVCYTQTKIEQNIIKFSKNHTKTNFEKEAKEIRMKYFAPTNRDSVRSFLHLK
jgi:hypothetical protein